MMNDHENSEEMRQEAQDSATKEQVADSPNSFMKNVALFFASPFIALAYAAALPFVGLYQFTKLSHETRVRLQRRARKQEKRARKQASKLRQ